ncbi:methyltransferase domain-containing protein [Streptomyces sp. NRRL B-1677]|uniref:SAM-dependent methyltransferase n=1 Tax=Streptomyces sp. NRRL B-1677 TaxID=2682966 RepID=UPI001892B5B0|nr:class I SAM-dependent methyltransferase [Streptomyces sp. NRRL B-1677]MBF6047199.1 methyltransferase domain-containing protein [Streptomyces sp. NRRL B-1677]
MTSTPTAPTAPGTPPPLTSADVAAWYEASDELCKLISGDSFHYGLWQQGDLDGPQPAREPATRAQERMTDFFCDLLGLEPGHHLLDVGCGHGSPALHAARQRGIEVTGCSISHDQISEATHRGRRGHDGAGPLRLRRRHGPAPRQRPLRRRLGPPPASPTNASTGTTTPSWPRSSARTSPRAWTPH